LNKQVYYKNDNINETSKEMELNMKNNKIVPPKIKIELNKEIKDFMNYFY